MKFIIDFILNNDTIIMASLFLLIIVLLLIVVIMDAVNRRKNSKNAKLVLKDENNNITDVFKENLSEEVDLSKTEDLGEYTTSLDNDSKKSDITEIKYVDEDDEELEKTKAQLELKNLKEELLKAELKEKTAAEKAVMIEDEEEQIPTIEDSIDQFELSQEENAIISLDQFNKVSDKIYNDNEITQYKDEGNEPISIQELEKLYNSNETVIKDDINTDVKEEKIETTEAIQSKFKSSPIISPVFGIDDGGDESINNMALENTANLDKLNEEIRKTNEFLNTLRELRKNLQ